MPLSIKITDFIGSILGREISNKFILQLEFNIHYRFKNVLKEKK